MAQLKYGQLKEEKASIQIGKKICTEEGVERAQSFETGEETPCCAEKGTRCCDKKN
jgi:hypothetical protein